MKVEIHKITRCGFFELAGQRELFGGLQSWATDLHNWIGSRKSVAATVTDQGQDHDRPSTFCAGTALVQNGLGMILWHAMPSTEKGVAFISETSKPGSVQAKETNIGPGNIPGWPTYFWLDHGRQLIVSLQPTGRIRNRTTGFAECRDYLRGWLRISSPFVHKQNIIASANEASFDLAWRETPNHPPRADLYVHFDSKPVTTAPALDIIRQRYSEIRKLVYAVQISRSLPVEKTRLEKIFDVLGYPEITAPATDHLSFRWETDWQPTLDELNSLIDRANGSTDIARKERQAVRMRNEQKLYWLDKSYVKEEVTIDEHLETKLHWTVEDLTEAIAAVSPEINGWLKHER